MRHKLNLWIWARVKVLSELGMAAGIIMASDGLSGSMFSNRAVRHKLNLWIWARVKVLSELGMAAGIIMASDGLSGSMFSNRAVRHKLNLWIWARVKVLSELGMAAGIIMASDGLSGSMLFTASQLGAVHFIARIRSRHRPGWDLSAAGRSGGCRLHDVRAESHLVTPQTMQQHGKPSCQGHLCLLAAAAGGNPFRPDLEGAGFAAPGEQSVGGLEQQRAGQTIPGLGDVASAIDLARLVARGVRPR